MNYPNTQGDRVRVAAVTWHRSSTMHNDRTARLDSAAALARRVRRARLAAALARLENVAASPNWDRIPACDRLAILREIRATRAALNSQ